MFYAFVRCKILLDSRSEFFPTPFLSILPSNYFIMKRSHSCPAKLETLTTKRARKSLQRRFLNYTLIPGNNNIELQHFEAHVVHLEYPADLVHPDNLEHPNNPEYPPMSQLLLLSTSLTLLDKYVLMYFHIAFCQVILCVNTLHSKLKKGAIPI